MSRIKKSSFPVYPGAEAHQFIVFSTHPFACHIVAVHDHGLAVVFGHFGSSDTGSVLVDIGGIEEVKWGAQWKT